MAELEQVVDLLTEIRDLLAAQAPAPIDDEQRTRVTGD
jgi:hypothetical protein